MKNNAFRKPKTVLGYLLLLNLSCGPKVNVSGQNWMEVAERARKLMGRVDMGH
jgi:hypothetical protein